MAGRINLDGHELSHELLESVKPRLRGWLHAGVFPVSVVAGIVLICLASSGRAQVACAIYAVTAMLLFGVSALFHRGNWSPRANAVLRRLDHANIFLIIAGSYTPFTLLLLPPGRGRILLWVVWIVALAGIAFRVLWVGASRWIYTPVYIALGWAAVLFAPDFARQGETAVLVLIIIGGVLYSIGGIIYAARRPDPSPRWFGFHEVFHSFTLVAYIVHYVAVSMTAIGAD
jgi:hemolysin III